MIYLIWAEKGEYSDTQTKVVCYFKTREEAEEAKARLQEKEPYPRGVGIRGTTGVTRLKNASRGLPLSKRFFTTRKESRPGWGQFDDFHEVEVDLAELLKRERYDYLHADINALEVGQRLDGGCYYDTIIRLKDAE